MPKLKNLTATFWVLFKHCVCIPTVPPHSVHFARAIARPWVSTLGRFGHILVEEGSGFFMRYCGSKWVDGKVFKNRVENWKIAFLAFFVNLVKCPILPNKVPFFYFWLIMGMGEIDTDTIGHDKLGILGTNQLFLSKKSPIGTAVPMSHLKLLLLPNVLVFKQIWLLYPNHDGKLKNLFFFNFFLMGQLSHCHILVKLMVWHFYKLLLWQDFCPKRMGPLSQRWNFCPKE